MESPRVVGHVVAVNGFRIKVELLSEARSSSRATLDGISRAIAINSFLVFDLGAGSYAIGSLSDLEARESYDPSDDELTLELTKPRRIATVQLLGTVVRETAGKWRFDVGITILPTLDTPAEIADPEILSGLFMRPPLRNRPDGYKDQDFDLGLEIGHQSGEENVRVHASFNDLFSRPFAVVGNTGSGKSYTVASVIQSALKALERTTASEPHIFILDINGEYSNAFLGDEGAYERQPNKIYLNGTEFSIPIWLMNSEEITAWLNASEATQEPVLKDWWSISKAKNQGKKDYDPLHYALTKIEAAISWLESQSSPANGAFESPLSTASDFLGQGWDVKSDVLDKVSWKGTGQWKKIRNEKDVKDALHDLKNRITKEISTQQNSGETLSKSGDSPLYVPFQSLIDPNLVDRAVNQENANQINQYLTTLKLRLRTRLDDRRWQSFFNYEDLLFGKFEDWLKELGIGGNANRRVSVIDLSMLATEVLPFACAIVGRLLLETREMSSPSTRNKYPWTLVLEEAHNYASPRRINDDRGHELSRKTFERIAKEGRKFGLSLVVASQRPSEISPTIISQCANFFSHRLQNPDDIDHFRRIIPKQAQRMLDQVTVLASGEAIVFGSAMHVPARVQINNPTNPPWSSTAAPWIDWRKTEAFPLAEVIENWGLNSVQSNNVAEGQAITTEDEDIFGDFDLEL